MLQNILFLYFKNVTAFVTFSRTLWWPDVLQDAQVQLGLGIIKKNYNTNTSTLKAIPIPSSDTFFYFIRCPSCEWRHSTAKNATTTPPHPH